MLPVIVFYNKLYEFLSRKCKLRNINQFFSKLIDDAKKVFSLKQNQEFLYSKDPKVVPNYVWKSQRSNNFATSRLVNCMHSDSTAGGAIYTFLQQLSNEFLFILAFEVRRHHPLIDRRIENSSWQFVVKSLTLITVINCWKVLKWPRSRR